MDTSDSEYFESADEDLESDPKPVQRQIPSHPEPALCKLKIDEEPVSKTTNLPPEPKECNDNNEESIKAAVVKDSNDIRSISPQKDTTHRGKPEVEESENLCKDKVEESPAAKDNSPQKDTTGEARPLVQPEPDEAKEENLWEDDEIDWETEATKEESHQPIKEDSGWGDFDADWEADNNSLSKEQVTTTIKNEEENLWEDDWEPINKPKEEEIGHDKLPKEEDSSWGNWGSWGVTSLLNTATQGVSTITNHVSQVIESGIGIPDPEEMARLNRAEKPQELHEKKSDSPPTTPSAFGLGNFVSGVSQLTKFVESTSSKVITGGLGTLEAIGKKTVEVLQEGDPGFKKKKAFLKLDNGKPNLSQILREAKERTEDEINSNKQNINVETRKIKNYETLFDDHEGLVHLEALEMLSKLCSIKLDNLTNSSSGESLKDLQETLEQVKELCEIPEDDEDEERVQLEKAKEVIGEAVSELGISISYDKLFKTYEETDKWLEGLNLKFMDCAELHQQAIDTLAQLTALAVEQFHKAAELLLVKEHRSTVDEADSLVQITTTLKSLILRKADNFTDKLNSIGGADKEKANEQITNIFYEAENSGTYIQDAFNLLLPVLQVGVTSS